VGVNDQDIVNAVNCLIQPKGGISLCNGEKEMVLGLPVGGLMTTNDGYETATLYEQMDQEAKRLGSKLGAPYMTLSFLALLVIPKLKLSDKGLFDGEKFQFTSLYA
jgi:adenine deaminase